MKLIFNILILNNNLVIIEWKKGNFNRKCQAFSIFQNEKLLKSNIPIINDKIDFGDIDINGIVNLKCDKFVKQKRETLDNDKGMSSEQENEESSIIESEEEDKSIINSIDNSYDPSKENESEKEEEIVNNKNNLSNNESKGIVYILILYFLFNIRKKLYICIFI